MMVSCPCCASFFELVAGIEDADGRRWHALACELPPSVIKPLIRYLRLFKPDKQGLRWSRMLKLTQELAPLIKAAQLSHNHTTYTAPAELWASMMTMLVDNPSSTLKLPLKTNGYLLSMIAGSAEQDAARTEQAVITTARHRPAIAEQNKPKKADAYIPDNWADDLRKRINGGAQGDGDQPRSDEEQHSEQDAGASGAG